MFSLLEPPILSRLRAARRILVAGAGGGLDIYAGLPPALALRSAGKEVHLANLSFADLYGFHRDVWVDRDIAAVRPDTQARGDYFPERSLARWLDLHDLPSTVYAFPADRRAAPPGRVPHADRAPRRGRRGRRCLAALDREGAYLGAFSLPRESREGQSVLRRGSARAGEHAGASEHRQRCGGGGRARDFGVVRFTERTRGGELFVSPLMPLYSCVDAPGLSRRNLYLDRLEKTALIRQVSTLIEEFRDGLPRQRPPRAYPH